jgi:hypothetical protein
MFSAAPLALFSLIDLPRKMNPLWSASIETDVVSPFSARRMEESAFETELPNGCDPRFGRLDLALHAWIHGRKRSGPCGRLLLAPANRVLVEIPDAGWKGRIGEYRVPSGGRRQIEVRSKPQRGGIISMTSKFFRRFRLAFLVAIAATMFAQAVQVTRVAVVDSAGMPVNGAARTPSRRATTIVSTIDRNEAAGVELCQNYVDAQLAYFRSSRRADGYLAFAEKIRSSPGARDGLYWERDVAGDESPAGPRLAAAAAAELGPFEVTPHFGYYVKVLLAQGPDAVGGARDYRVDGRLISGFALIAWPAEYGVTGFRSFQINQLGDVYAKDLGSDTAAITMRMTAFAPDRTWKKVASGTE